MVLYPYSFQAAFDPNIGEAAPRDSVGQVFAVGDRTFSNPLPTVDLNGMPVTLTVGEFGYLPDFMVEDHTAVVWKSGEYVFQFATTIPVKGDEGEVGKSAYQSAVEQGFVGTESEWLETLKGANVVPTEEVLAPYLLQEEAPAVLAGQLESFGTPARVVVDSLLSDRDKLGFTLKTAYNQSPRFKYHVLRVHTEGFVPGLVEKHYAENYEKQGTSGTAFTPPRIPLTTFFDQVGGAQIVVNADAWGMPDGQMTGLQIKDGIMYHDFSDWYKGEDSLGILPDGRFKIYRTKDGHTAQTALDDNVITTFSMGPGLVIDGQQVDMTDILSRWPNLPDPNPQTILGQSIDGDIIIILIEGRTTDSPGLGGQAIAGFAKGQGCHQAVLLDGGGSTQAVINGAKLVESSDGVDRPVPSVMAIRAPQTNQHAPASATRRPIVFAGTTTSPNNAGYIVKNAPGGKRLSVRGQITGISDTNKIIGTMPGVTVGEWIYLEAVVERGTDISTAQLVLKPGGELSVRRKVGTFVASDIYNLYFDLDL